LSKNSKTLLHEGALTVLFGHNVRYVLEKLEKDQLEQ